MTKACVNRVDAGARATDEIVAQTSELLAAEREEIEAGLRWAVESCQQDLAEAIKVRNAYLRFRVEAEGASVASAARAVGVSRQMARRILGEVDNETLEGVRDGLGRLRGAALSSWIGRMEDETIAILRAAIPANGDGGDDA